MQNLVIAWCPRGRFSFLCIIALLSLSPLLPATPVVLQEIYYDQPGADGSDVFSELFGPAGFSLDGWSLQGINGTNGGIYRRLDLTGSVIPTDGIFVISNNNANSSLLSVTDLTANVDWQNGPDAVFLVDDQNIIQDALQYGLLTGFNRAEGIAATDVSAGYSLSRHYAGLDSNDNFVDFVALDSPTPGTAKIQSVTLNSAYVGIPSPGTFYLLLMGMVVILLPGIWRRGASSIKTSAYLAVSA